MAKRKARGADAPTFALAVRGDTSRVGTDDNPVGVDPIIAEARKRWKKCDDAEDGQRTAIMEAKKFRSGDQWPAAIKLQRQGAGSIQGQAAQPPRPCLVIDRLSQPARQLSNAIRSAQFAIDVLPNGFGADEDTANMLKGYARYVQNKARLDSPIEWAADGAIEGGIGWFRLRTDYVHNLVEDTEDPSGLDQELCLERIANNLSVYADPSAQTPTKRDMLFAFVTQDLDRDDFASQFPKADLASLDDFCAQGDTKDKAWATSDTIRIAEYWRVTFTNHDLNIGGQSRTVRKKKVEGFKITATQILERWDWLGSRIPLFPVIGEELNIEGKQLLRGIISEGMDAQRMLNYTYSGAVETFALAPKAPFVAAAGQIDPYIEFWKVANTSNLSYLPYEPVALGGTALPPPMRQMAEPPIQAAVALMLRSEEAIKATTGVYDPALEYNNPREHSGTAISQLQQQSETTSGNYQLNVQRALIDVGEQIVEIAPKITRPGQILHIIGADDVPEQVMVGVPFMTDDKGRPRPAQPDEIARDLHEFYDPTKGKYGVTVTVGKATATQRQEGAQALGQLLPHLPEPMQAALTPEYIENLSFPGAHKMAEIARKTLPPQLQQQLDGQPQVPPEVQQQMALMQQQMQELSKLADKNRTDLTKTQMQQAGETQRAAADHEADMAKAELAASAQLAIAQSKVDAENFRSYVDALETRVAKTLDLHMAKTQQLHEHIQNTLDRQHEHRMANVQAQTALAQGAQQHAAATAQADQQAQIASSQQASQQGHEAAMADQAASAQGDGAGV